MTLGGEEEVLERKEEILDFRDCFWRKRRKREEKERRKKEKKKIGKGNSLRSGRSSHDLHTLVIWKCWKNSYAGREKKQQCCPEKWDFTNVEIRITNVGRQIFCEGALWRVKVVKSQSIFQTNFSAARLFEAPRIDVFPQEPVLLVIFQMIQFQNTLKNMNHRGVDISQSGVSLNHHPIWIVCSGYQKNRHKPQFGKCWTMRKTRRTFC